MIQTGELLLKLTLLSQILGVTCDNASNNDKMIENLADLIEHFPGAVNQICCFVHILNLVAKSILQQFDVQKRTVGDESMDFDNARTVLDALALELEGNGMLAPVDSVEGELDDSGIDDDEKEGDDNDDGLGDERNGMSEEEVRELEESLVLIQLMLTKVCKQKNLILNHLMANTASGSRECYQKFIKNHPSSVAGKTQGLWPQGPYDAMHCLNLMELYL